MSIDLGSAFGRIILEAQDALDQTGKVGKALGGLAGPAGMMAAGIATAGAAAGGALIALGASSVGVAREFESSMAIMSTAVDPISVGAQTTAEAMGILGDASLAVGSDTSLVGVSASTAAEAMTGLYKAGLSTGEIFGDLQGYLGGTAELSGALRASIDLAAASELDMVQASELAAITLATFGGELTTEAERAEFINQAMNNFVQTADGSVASVQDLSDAFINVGSTAAGMGIPLEDMNTALGILSTRGIAGAEAGTAFKSMLTNMMTAPKAAKALDGLGVSLYDVNGQMRPLEQIVGDLETAMAGMTDEQRTQTTVALASSYGQKALNALLAEGATGWADMESAISGAATMEETAAARTNTLAGAQEALSGVWESFQIKVGTALIPVLTSLADIGASLIEKYGPTLTAAFEAFGNGVSRIVEILTTGNLGELFTVFEDGSSTLGSIFEAFGMGEEKATALGASISNLVTRFQEFVAPIADAVTDFVSFKDVLAGLGIIIAATVLPAVISLVASLAPILLVVGAVIGIVALLRNAWENNWGGIQEKTQAVIDFIRPLIENGIQAIRDFWAEHGDAILSKAREIWEGVQSAIETVVDIIREKVGEFLENLRAFWEEHGEAIKQTAEDAWNLIKDTIENVVETIKDIFEAFRLAFEGDWEGFGEKLFEIWEDAWNLVTDFLSGLWDMVLPWLTELWESVKSWFTETDWKQLGLDIINGIVNGLNNAGQAIVDTISGFVQAAWDKVKAFFGISSPSTLMYWAGQMIAQGLIDGIRSMTGTAAEAMDALFEAMGNVAGLGGGFGGEFKRRVLDPLEAGLDDLNQQIEGYDDSIQGMAEMLGLGDLVGTPGWEQMIQRFIDSPFASDEQRGIARTLMASLRERARLTAEQIEMQRELIRQQERLAAMEEKRAQIGFLQQQLDLIKLITDNGLGLDILQGIELGIGADPGALMDAMAAAMRRMIQAAEDELGIASASKVFKRIAAQAQEGLIVQMADSRGVVRAARGMVRNMAESAELALAGVGVGTGSAGAVDSSRRLTMYGGQHFYFQQRRGSVLEEVQGLLSP